MIIIFSLFSSALNLLYAQQHALTKQWDKRFGGTLQEDMTGVVEDRNNGYLLVGSSFSGISGDKTQDNWDNSYMSEDFWIVKIDSIGNKIWDRRYGGLWEDFPSNFQQTKDGGSVLGGESYSNIGGDKSKLSWGGGDYWVVKIDSASNKQWEGDYGGIEEDLLFGLRQTSDGGYILGGTSYSPISGDKTHANWGATDYWVVKTDSLGNKLWDADYGGTDYQFLYALCQAADGGFILGGISSSDISGDKTQANWAVGGYNFWVVKIDSAGNKIWDKVFGGTAEEDLRAMIATPDGGFLVGGWSLSGIGGDKTQNSQGGYDYWIIKIDSIGNKQWDKGYGGSGDDKLFSLALTNDGGYLIGGDSQSQAGGDKTENNTTGMQTWIIKTDSSGNKQWDKTIFVNGNTATSSAFQTKDGCYVIGSFSGAEVGYYKSQPSWDSSSDYWIVKFCDTLINGITDITETDKVQLSIYPNPFATDIAIALQKPDLKQADFTICNTLGQTVYTQHETNLSPSYTKMLDLRYLPNGVYFVEVVVDGERITKEVVKE